MTTGYITTNCPDGHIPLLHVLLRSALQPQQKAVLFLISSLLSFLPPEAASVSPYSPLLVNLPPVTCCDFVGFHCFVPPEATIEFVDLKEKKIWKYQMIRLYHNLANAQRTLYILLKRYVFFHIHCCSIHNSLEMETI